MAENMGKLEDGRFVEMKLLCKKSRTVPKNQKKLWPTLALQTLKKELDPTQDSDPLHESQSHHTENAC